MYFSDYYEVTKTAADEWFDPLLETDTTLFVDPFLIYKDQNKFWLDSSERLAKHFEVGFKLLAGFENNPRSLNYRQTVEIMQFPEPKEFGLGFVSKGTRGSGTGTVFAKNIVRAMAEAIKRSLENMKHFEELGILVEGIAEDRISDIACNILKSKFITYTQDIAIRHNIPMENFLVTHASFNESEMAWEDLNTSLPKNPVTGSYILLTPKRFLRRLPTLNDGDWRTYLASDLNLKMNLSLLRKMPKPEIVRLARENAEKVREWTTSREEKPPTPYDVDNDPAGYHNWQLLTRDFANLHPLGADLVQSFELDTFIESSLREFKHYVEHGGGWKLLWNEKLNKEKPEENIQLLFKGVMLGYCHAYSVKMLREVNFGTGPVDFVFNDSTQSRLLEVKKLSSSSFWSGMEQQLTSYLTSAQCDSGWYVAVQFGDTKSQLARAKELASRTTQASSASGFKIKSMLIDSRTQISASKRRSKGGVHPPIDSNEDDVPDAE